MRFSTIWLKDFVKIPPDVHKLAESLTMAGHLLDKLEKNADEYVLDLELRGNRADCYSVYGMAGEISAITKQKIRDLDLHPKINKVSALKNCSLKICSKNVKRVILVTVKNIKITKSPSFIITRLKEYGIEPINNIVDLTNYVMVETGQPLHAYDLDLVDGLLEIRMARDNESITTFTGEKLKLTNEDLVWSSKGDVCAVAGAIGGKKYSIQPTTKTIVLEAANYNRANIRKAIHRLNLFTEAGIRHEKELDPNLCETGVLRFLYFIKKYGWGDIIPESSDFYPKPAKEKLIDFNISDATNLAGVNLKLSQVKGVLSSLSFKTRQKSKKVLSISIPTFRTDIESWQDITEEILRIEGYDKIPTTIMAVEIPNEITPSYITQEIKTKEILSLIGFREAITLSFVKDKFQAQNDILEVTHAEKIEIQNPPSPDMKNLRMSLLPNLLELTKRIINERGNKAALFEIGKIYYKQKHRYVEKRRLGLISFNESGSFYTFKGQLEAYFTKLGLGNVRYLESFEIPNLKESYKISFNGDEIGWGGKIDSIHFAEIDLEKLLNYADRFKPKVEMWPKYPPQIEDMTLKLPQKTYIGEVVSQVKNAKFVSDVYIKDIYEDNYTLRVTFLSKQKTLNNKEVAHIREGIIKELKTKYHAVLI